MKLIYITLNEIEYLEDDISCVNSIRVGHRQTDIQYSTMLFVVSDLFARFKLLHNDDIMNVGYSTSVC